MAADFDEPVGLPVVPPRDHVLCVCAACRHHREMEEGLMCFGDMMAETNTGGHGPCVDPWNIGCTCTGTAADGECEGCWLFLK